MHVGAILLIALIVLACSGPQAIWRALCGLGCLIMIGAILLGLLWAGEPDAESLNHECPA
jgi:hypothetical protein